jgi:hypothetical protein
VATNIKTIRPLVEALLVQTLSDLVENGDTLQQFRLFRDDQVQCSITTALFGAEHHRAIVAEVGRLSKALGSDCIAVITDVFCTLHQRTDVALPPSADPRAQEAIWCEIVQPTESLCTLIPYGRADDGAIVFAPAQPNAARGDAFDAWMITELTRALSEAVSTSSTLTDLEEAQRGLADLEATVLVNAEALSRLSASRGRRRSGP